jgi:hypothetical protein
VLDIRNLGSRSCVRVDCNVKEEQLLFDVTRVRAHATRGLKQRASRHGLRPWRCLAHTGAWIETIAG